MRRTAQCAVLVLILIAVAQVSSTRPEIVLANIFSQPFAPRTNASFECIHDSEIYLQALANYTPWALQMFDSSVKIPPGVITGNHRLLGNFDECLRVDSNEHRFIGQACTVKIQFDIKSNNDSSDEPDLGDLLRNVAIASGATNWTSGVTIVYEWLWCVPSTCSYSEIQRATEIAFKPLIIPGRVDLTVNVDQQSCHTRETSRVTWDIADCYYTSLLVLIALIVIISTGYDIALKHSATWSKWASHEKTKQWKAVFTSFSLYKNGEELLRTDRPKGYLGCLDGLRFLSICWIIYGHTHYMEATSVKLNLADIPRMHYDWTNMLVLNANIGTDTFFLLSGIVLAYNELSKKERVSNWQFNVTQLWIRRYLRLTPAYAMMIGFYATLFYKFGTGPHWDLFVGTNRDYCRENWWLNLIYLNNYFNLDKMCMSQSWYLSVDMQLVWLSPLIVYPMLRFKRRYFIIILNVCLLLSFLVPFAITYIFNLPGTMLYYKEQTSLANVYMQIYSKVYCRFGTYVIGLGLGYILYETRTSRLKMHALTVICGWLIAITIGLSALLGLRDFYFDTHHYNKLEASFYAGFHRQGFVLSICWIIFCCMHGYAGPVNRLLSWSAWVPCSKLTYCAYLSHYLFLITDVGSRRAADNLTRMNVVRTFFANLIFTLALSVVWYLCLEKPFLILERAIFDRKRAPPRKQDVGSTGTNAESCRSTDESSASTRSGRDDNPEKYTETDKEKRENKRIDDVYVIKPTEIDDAPNAERASLDVGKSGYVNINFYRSFNEHEQSTTNPSEIASGSTDIEANFSNAKSNECLK